MAYNIHSGNGKALQKINLCFLDQNLVDDKLVLIQTYLTRADNVYNMLKEGRQFVIR